MFGVAFAFQSTLSQLVDLGFSTSIVALAGERAHDPKWLGRYLAAARFHRNRMMLMILLGAVVAFPLMTANQQWGISVKTLLLTGLIAGIVSQGWIMYGVPLLVHRLIGWYYMPQIFAAIIRLALCGALYVTGVLSGWVVTWIGALALALVGLSYRRLSRGHVTLEAIKDVEANKQMLVYLKPLIPGVIFTAFQGQISIAIITLFGATRNIAEVSALGRIGQLFLVLTAFNAVFIDPYFSRINNKMMLRRYIQILSAAIFIAASLTIISFIFPKPLLWVLGAKYSGLREDVGWVVCASSLGYIGGVMWTMHASRRWVYGWASAAYIAVILTIQILFISCVDLSTTRNVILLGVVTSAGVLLVHLMTALIGFKSANRDDELRI
jgi:hypothetical protein